MNHKEVRIAVRRSGTLAFDVCIKAGHLALREECQASLDYALIPNTTFRLFDWAASIVEEPHPSQNLQKEFVYIAARTFCGEGKPAFKLLNVWVDGIEKKIGKGNLTIEFERN